MPTIICPLLQLMASQLVSTGDAAGKPSHQADRSMEHLGTQLQEAIGEEELLAWKTGPRWGSERNGNAAPRLPSPYWHHCKSITAEGWEIVAHIHSAPVQSLAENESQEVCQGTATEHHLVSDTELGAPALTPVLPLLSWTRGSVTWTYDQALAALVSASTKYR